MCVDVSVTAPPPRPHHGGGVWLIWTYAGSIWTCNADKPYYVKSIIYTYQWLSILHYLTVALCTPMPTQSGPI